MILLPTSRRPLNHPGKIALLLAGLGLGCAGALAQRMAPEPIAPPGVATVTTVAIAAPAVAASRSAGTLHAHGAGKKAAAAKRKKKSRAERSARDDDAPDSVLYGRRDDVLAFAAQVAEDRGLARSWVESQLARARYQPGVARAIMPAAVGTAKNWAAYRARFVEPQRLKAGVQWWQANARALADAQATYGVPPEIVAGIVGVETFYGRMTGHYRVLDALATLAFDFPAGRDDRSAFYRSELRAYLVWCALEGREADSVRGSFAGAIGWPQFMPSSLLKYAVDFDRDGHADLSTGGSDVVGSVAGYLAQFGWQRGMPTTFAVSPPLEAAARARLLAPDIVPSFSAAEMLALGAELPDAARGYAGRLALVELQNGAAAPSYVAGTANFYAVTRYNRSSYYAMAVIALGDALKREMNFASAARVALP